MPSSRGAFDCVRLLAAAAVLFGHSYALTGHDSEEPLIRLSGGNAGFGEVAVYAFFAISGYLITQSWLRDPSLPRFIERRLRRIGPALVLVICGSVLIVGPLVTALPLREYFSRPEAWTYLAKILIYPPQLGLPGAFEDNPFPVAVNGSLWTLRLEFALYLAVAALGACGLLRRRLTVPLAVSCVAASALLLWAPSQWASPLLWISPFRSAPFLHQFLHQFLILCLNATPFFVGAALAQSDVRPERTGSAGWLALALAGIALAFVFPPILRIVLIVMLPVAVVLLCVRGRCGLSRFGDCSYGLYLWGFPVQQTVIHFAPGIAPLSLFAVAGGAAFICALLSWHLVEKTALRRKLARLEPVAVDTAGKTTRQNGDATAAFAHPAAGNPVTFPPTKRAVATRR
jgi:peptidoglycan/LPS O-acetylase OafA/YrhL